MNKVILVGRIGKDAEVKTFENNNLIRFSLATSEKYKKDNEWVEQTEWHNVEYWAKSQKIAEYLVKGQEVVIDGKIKTTKHEEKYYTNIIAQRINLVGGRQEPQSRNNEPTSAKTAQVADDLPF